MTITSPLPKLLAAPSASATLRDLIAERQDDIDRAVEAVRHLAAVIGRPYPDEHSRDVGFVEALDRCASTEAEMIRRTEAIRDAAAAMVVEQALGRRRAVEAVPEPRPARRRGRHVSPRRGRGDAQLWPAPVPDQDGGGHGRGRALGIAGAAGVLQVQQVSLTLAGTTPGAYSGELTLYGAGGPVDWSASAPGLTLDSWGGSIPAGGVTEVTVSVPAASVTPGSSWTVTLSEPGQADQVVAVTVAAGT